jgi:hypothetical protein
MKVKYMDKVQKMGELCKLYIIAHIRNRILQESDKCLLPDYPISPDQLLIAEDYRQKLRDFTKNNYIMSDKPTFIITLN